MSLLKPSTKALALSCKVSVRTDNRGFLSLQYLVRNDDGQICFVEYYCCPDEEVEENWEHQIQIWLVISTLTTHRSPVCQRRQVWRKCRTCNGHSGVNRKWTDSSFARFERCSYALYDYATRHNRSSMCCRSIQRHVRCVFKYSIDYYGDSAVFSHKSHNLWMLLLNLSLLVKCSSLYICISELVFWHMLPDGWQPVKQDTLDPTHWSKTTRQWSKTTPILPILNRCDFS